MDELIRATAMEGKVRAFAVQTTELVEELRKRQDTYSTATAALGRAASAGAMMGAMLKGEEKLTLQIKGDGPLGQIMIDANAKGEVRGYVDNPHTDLPDNAQGKFDVAGAVGRDGYLNVIKDLGMKEPYRGSSPIVSGELAEDFTYYFAQSEQTPSAVGLGVLIDTDYSVKAAGGFIIQLLPGLREEEITAIEQQLSSVPPVTALLEEGLSLEEILQKILGSVKVLERMDITFRCKCSKERVEQMLISLGRDELEQLAGQEEQTEVVCHFCNQAYRFENLEIRRLLEHV